MGKSPRRNEAREIQARESRKDCCHPWTMTVHLSRAGGYPDQSGTVLNGLSIGTGWDDPPTP